MSGVSTKHVVLGLLIERPGYGYDLAQRLGERLFAEGHGPDDVLPPAESVAIMGTLDEIRRQIGLRYLGE